MKKLGIVIGSILLVGIAITLVTLNLLSDKTGPVIVFETTDFIYSEGNTYDDLLAGVTATDDVDGDVTDSLMIVSVIPLTDNYTAKVQYVAKDSANNISITNLIVDYEPLPPAVEAIEVPTESQDVNATMVGDDSITTKETTAETTDTTAMNDAIEPSATMEPSNNSEPVIAEDTNDVVENTDDIMISTELPEQSKSGYPYIKLSSNEITIKKGFVFNVYSVIEELEDDKDNNDDLWRRIQVHGEYHTSQAGSYELKYFATDEDLNQSNIEYLTLNVVD